MSSFIKLLSLVHRFNLLDTPQMTASVERGLQPNAHDLKRGRLVNRALSQRKHIGVVVRPRPLRSLLIPTQGAADARNFIGHDGLAVSRTAEDDAPFTLAARDRFSRWPDENRIVHWRRARRAEVAYLVPSLRKVPLDYFFVSKAGVVGSNGNFHKALVGDLIDLYENLTRLQQDLVLMKIITVTRNYRYMGR